jgi:hypothetical protein
MIFITKTKNYKTINKQLLKLISKIKNPYLEKGTSICNTDWSLPRSYKRDYLNYFLNFIKPYMNELATKLYSKNWTIHNSWFQQYSKSNYHEWHTHPETNFTNVYFIELPNESLGTEIFNCEKLKLQEGDLLTFPGYFYHRSFLNKTKKRKTIISFNSSFSNFYK